jgi:dephospho-CoA kinase
MILNVEGLAMLPAEYRQRCFVIYLDIPFEVRAERLAGRGDSHDPWERRIEADEKQYESFTNFDCRINNPKF